MSSAHLHLDRWQAAGLIDSETVARIRDWESQQQPTEARRWPAILALTFGALLLTAGLLLFVSAHWDQMSPNARFTLVLSTVAALHIGGAFAKGGLSMALHAVGTLSLGGAIALTGQIFHLSEHWPGGVMLWAAGAAVGWWMLRQWPQAALTAVLVPAWLASECFAFHFSFRMREAAPAFTGLCALCLVYLGARRAANDDTTRKALGWIGALALFPIAILSGVERWNWNGGSTRELVAWAIAILVPLAVGYFLRCLPAAAISVAWTLGLYAIGANGGSRELPIYLWYAIGSGALAWWGILEKRAERINLGMAGFAFTILFFYFSSVMDKLGRSASLIALGILFLGGGWALEHTRRRLIGNLEEVA